MILDNDDSARFLGVNKSTLWKYRQSGLRARRVGGEIYFFQKDLLAWAKPKRGRPRKEVKKVTKNELLEENESLREALQGMRSRIDELLNDDLDNADETEDGE